ncbi:anthranilate synthase component II, partial [Pseudoalteromonas sp. SG43-6]|nr:anthranilate synthase component II [Pseudoalteromonas sp. SG43-6]
MSENINNLTDLKIYFLDNFDSFSYNLVDELSMLGSDLVVYRNNIDAQVIYDKMCAETKPVILVLSPGPGTP